MNGFQFEKFAVSVAIRSRQHKVKVEVQVLICEAPTQTALKGSLSKNEMQKYRKD